MQVKLYNSHEMMHMCVRFMFVLFIALMMIFEQQEWYLVF